MEGRSGVDEEALRRMRLSVAPMMDVTHTFFRRFMRLLTRETLLYTEMVVDSTLLHVPEEALEKHLCSTPMEAPLALQLGGSDPQKVADAVSVVQTYVAGGTGSAGCNERFVEYNLNCGCPSSRVAQSNDEEECFGAALMRNPDRVREVMAAVGRRITDGAELTVKCRIGIDGLDAYSDLANFVQTVSSETRGSGSPVGGGRGVSTFIVHARKCMLNGISPAQNRQIPPLRYHVVHELVQEFPHLQFVLNGGIQFLTTAEEHSLAPHWVAPTSVLESSMSFPSASTLFPSAASPPSAGQDHDDIDADSVISSTMDDVSIVPARANGEETKTTSVANDEDEQKSGGGSRDRAGDRDIDGDGDDGEECSVLPPVHGVMIGRTAYQNPRVFADADSRFFGRPDQQLSDAEILWRYMEIVEPYVDQGVARSILTVPVHGLFNGMQNGRVFRRAMTNLVHEARKDPNMTLHEIMHNALEHAARADIESELERERFAERRRSSPFGSTNSATPPSRSCIPVFQDVYREWNDLNEGSSADTKEPG